MLHPVCIWDLLSRVKTLCYTFKPSTDNWYFHFLRVRKAGCFIIRVPPPDNLYFCDIVAWGVLAIASLLQKLFNYTELFKLSMIYPRFLTCFHSSPLQKKLPTLELVYQTFSYIFLLFFQISDVLKSLSPDTILTLVSKRNFVSHVLCTLWPSGKKNYLLNVPGI